MAKVLIIEDDEVIASSMAQHLSGAGFDPVTVGRGEVGLARLRYEAPDVLVLDLMERGEAIEIEELRIDPREVQAYVDGENAELTPTEFRLLYALALDRGRVTTRDELLQKIWGRRETHRDRTVDVFVRRLRDKIDRIAPRHTFIQTRYGVGYKLEPVEKAGHPEE